VESEPVLAEAGALVLKKQKTGNEIVATDSGASSKALMAAPGVPRTSSLEAPIMQLSGHKGEVFTVRIGPTGKHLASGSFDKQIFLWNIHGECTNYAVLSGHASAVLEVGWFSNETHLLSCSADKSVAYWDHEALTRVRKFTQHSSFVNSCSPSRRSQTFASGSDDGTVRVWDARQKRSVFVFESKFPVLSVALSPDDLSVFSGGIDNVIKKWDIRSPGEPALFLDEHTDSVTGVKISHDGSYLLSNSMDNTVRIWDVRPYVKGSRCVKIFEGLQHNFEKNLLRCAWAPDGSKIAGASADRFVYIWDTTSRRILYKLPGHRGSVNDVDFHPTEPIIASCSSDQTIFLGEIKN